MRRPVPGGMRYAPKLSTCSRRKKQRRPAINKIINEAAQKIETVEGQKLTFWLDLGDPSSWYCGRDYCVRARPRSIQPED
jgi:hypothetical protein